MAETAPDIARAPREQQEKKFRNDLTSIAYKDIAGIRNKLVVFLEECGIRKACRGKIALTMTEVLTNLVKHPPVKAARIGIDLKATPEKITLDISDDSTAFSDFDARCKQALQKPGAAACSCEGGYGLSCILKQHANVWYMPGELSPDGLNHFIVEDFPEAAETQLRPEQKKNIFLVDDDPISLRIHEHMLSDRYNVIPFNDAPSALAQFEAARPDIVISDLHMPGMDGVELRCALAEIEGGNATPFIFLSGQKSGENNPYINQLGIDDFLCKPVTQGKLLSVLDRLVSRSEQLRGSLQGRIHQEMSTALRPDLPAMTQGWRIVTFSEVAEAGGGDFTLYQETPVQTLAVLADVMGHGPMAKFFSYAYAGYLRSIFRLFSESAGAEYFLNMLSQSVDGDPFLESIIMTCQAFQFFPDGRLRLASAGHPSPLLIRSHGQTCAEVDIAGPLPGLARDNAYPVREISCMPGDRMLFATDGFFDAFDRQGMRRERLMEALQQQSGVPIDTMAERLWAAFRDARARHLRAKDDATMIIAEYGGG